MKLKSHLSRRNGLQDQPKTVEIIAAIPEQFRKALLPALKTKPIRTASGVCLLSSPLLLVAYAKPPPYRAPDTRVLLLVAGVALDRGGGCDVQAAQVPAHCDDGQHLRLLPGGSRLGL